MDGSVAWLRIGHRGAAGSRPELTHPSFERAIELGVDMIELDVQLTRDRHLVVLHDRELGRTVAGRGPVREHSLAEVRSLDAGAWYGPAFVGLQVPTLDEVLELTRGRADLNVEIKSPPPDWAATAAVLRDVLDRHDRMSSTVISSFDMGALRAVREAAPRARLGVLWQSTDFAGMWAAAEELEAVSVHPHWMLADSEVIAAAHARAWQVLVWTVNEPDDIARLAAAGVDGIMSDYPERLRGGHAPAGAPGSAVPGRRPSA
jgi:glycerophosphoryl diester phosphodiesterase